MRLNLLLYGWLLLAAQVANAAQVPELFQGEVLVADQTQAARTEANQRALAQVLVKLSGSRQGIAPAALTGAENMVLKFQYAQRAYAPVPGMFDAPIAELLLQSNFDAVLAQQKLRAMGLNEWGRERPAPKVLLALDGLGAKVLLLNTQATPPRMFADAARRRGLPIEWAPGTLIGADALFAADDETLKTVAARIDAPAALFGRISRAASGGWQGRWSLVDDRGVDSWSVTDLNARRAIEAGAEGAADRLATRYSARPGQAPAQTITLTVGGVNSLNDYAKVTNYLRGLSLATRIDPLEADGATLKFRLALTTSLDRFVQVLGFGRVLSVERDATLEPGADPALAPPPTPLDELRVYLRP
jgi:uncharacterized protein